ncbi:TonB-dependent receptor [Chitinophaga sp. 212800010-3]|uniref:TonB-dependent receptor n=1 Tax=unclassified Chitinophaga TaxID=2619133 RepID=UPI002DF1FC89|nr:SusC/RagA family TonB-linked outer membrane protein [Chitinophaga sp. 212800010-3]
MNFNIHGKEFLRLHQRRGDGRFINQSKVFLVMKLTTLLLTGICLQVSATAFSQQVTLSEKNAPLKKVLQHISRQSGYTFFYDAAHLDEAKRITLNVINKPVDKVLDECFTGQPFTYEILDKTIIVKRRKLAEKENAAGPLVSWVLSGKVTNEKEEALPGATIKVLGTSKGVVTDVYGKFLIEIGNENDSLSVTFIGYKTQVIHPGNNRTITIKLLPDPESQKLNDVVVVGFGKQKKVSVTGAVSTVKISEVQQSATASLSNAIGGRLPGIITRQSSGEPGYDAASVFIRGFSTINGNRAPLVLVDGIERDMNNINVQEIESFSVLKDASATAVYGIRGANGVILINTKRGVEGRPKVSFRTETARLTALRLPEYINSYEYGILCNEAMANVGKPAFFTPEEIQKFKDHSDPYLYPDVDWISTTLKKNTMQTINNLSLIGGNQTFRYFTNVGFTMVDGIYKEDPAVPYKTNSSMKRYNFRSNVDVNVTRNLKIDLSLGGIIQNSNYPGAPSWAIFDYLRWTPNNAFPVKNPNGSVPAKNGFLNRSPYVVSTQTGYEKQFRNTIQSSLGTTWDLSSLVTKGLSVRGLFAYDFYNFMNNTRFKVPATFQYLGKDNNGVDQYLPIGAEQALSYGKGYDANRASYLELSVNYDRAFGKHRVGGLLLGNRREYVNLSADNSIGNIPFRRQGLASRVTYDYDSRYLLEFNAGYNGSENFPKGKRYGLFPSAAAGWIVSNESFWNKNIISSLKIRGSYGQVGNDQIGGARFLYLSTIDKGADNYPFGDNQTTQTGSFKENLIGNPNVTWEVSTKANVGVDMELLNGRITLTVDAFKERRSGILIRRGQIPISAGYPDNIIPYANLGIVSNKGIDGSLEIKNRTKSGFYYAFQGNFTFARNKILEDDSPEKPLAYQNSRGQSIDRLYGYEAIGLFKDQADIDKSPSQTSLQAIIHPGDIKYKDLNGDGKIDASDQTFFGYSRTPEIMYGFGGTVAWKGFDASIFFTGAARTSIFIHGRSIFAFRDGVDTYNVMREYFDNRWKPGADNTNARYPSVIDVKSTNNYVTNTLYVRNGNYLRLKSAEIGYSLNQALMKRIGISGIRVFLNGTNLAIWDHVKIMNPENDDNGDNGEGGYPLQSSINIGVQVNF